MTKEQILNGMSEEDFYNLYPDQASWENAQQMKLGGLSGAPHNGQPTAKEFFSYGSHANDRINIPMGNPLYLAYGGIPMDQQEGGFIDYNNNTTYPTFSQGGYDYEDGGMMNNSSDNYIYNYGGSYDPGLQKYQGDKKGSEVDYGKLADLKRQEKNNNMSIEGILSSFRPGEDTTAGPMGLAREKARAYQILLANKIKNHPDNIKKEEDGGSVINLINALTKAKKKAYGGANAQPGGNQSHIENLRSTFDGVINNNVHNALINEQADAVKEMYRTGGLMKAETGTETPEYNNCFNGNCYPEKNSNGAGTAVDPKVKQNAFKQNVDKYDNALNGSFSDLVYSNKRNNYYPNYYQGMNYMPMNYSPMNKISKEDDLKYQELLKNPSSQLTGYKNKSYLNGLFGRTEFTFKYKDKNSPAKTPRAFDGNNGIPIAPYGPNYKTISKGTTGPENINIPPTGTTIKGKLGIPSSHKSGLSGLFDNITTNPTLNYGGLYKAQYGVDHLSTDPKDGEYDSNGRRMPTGTNGMSNGWGASFTTPSNNVLSGKPNMPAGTAVGMKMTGASAINPQGQQRDAEGHVWENNPDGTRKYGWDPNKYPEAYGNKKEDETGVEKEIKITSKQRPNFNPEAVVNWTNTGMDVVSNIFNKAQDRSQEQLAAMQLGDNSFNVNNQENRGPYDINSGDFRPNEVLNTRYGGYMQQGGYPQQSAQQPNQEQIVQGVAQMLQQGAQPEEIAQQLIQMGLPQEEAMQLIQAVMQQLQGSQQQQPMQYGGYSMDEEAEEDEESYEDDLTEDEIAELRNGGYNVQYI